MEPKWSKRWIRRARGGPPEGWISKTAPDKPGDEISSPESGPRAHTRQRVEDSLPKKSGKWWRVESCFLARFPPKCRSASCTLEYEVSGRRRVGRKKSPAAKRSDGSGGEEIRRQRRRGDRTAAVAAEGSGRRIK